MSGRSVPELARPLALAAALLLAASPARADIDPPRGLTWLWRQRVVVENAAAFPDHVFVAWPCQQQYAPAAHCVAKGEDYPTTKFWSLGALYAIAARDLEVSRVNDPGAGDAIWAITRPAIAEEAAFFERDARVVRPGFPLEELLPTSIPAHTGIAAALHYLHVDEVGAAGVKAHFTRSRYRCWSGAEAEAPWPAGAKEPPIPTCLVDADPATGTPPPPAAEARALPPPAERLVWIGALVASLSLLGGGLLLRRLPS